MKILVLYYSMTGNVYRMAKLVAEGAAGAGAAPLDRGAEGPAPTPKKGKATESERQDAMLTSFRNYKE